MVTSLHRLQISLPEWQVQFLSSRAQRDGISMAEVIRQMIERESGEQGGPGEPDEFWGLVGAFEDHQPLLNGVAVSERPDLYLAAGALSSLHPEDLEPDQNKEESQR